MDSGVTIILFSISFVMFIFMYMTGARSRGQKPAKARLGGISELGAAEILLCSTMMIATTSVVTRWFTISDDPIFTSVVVYSMIVMIGTFSQAILGAVGIQMAEVAFAFASQFFGLFLVSKFPILQNGLAWLMRTIGL